MNTKKPTPRLINIKMAEIKDKERILKATREKQLVIYKGAPLRMLADFSTETLHTRRDWHEILSDEKQGCTTKITLPSKALV